MAELSAASGRRMILPGERKTKCKVKGRSWVDSPVVVKRNWFPEDLEKSSMSGDGPEYEDEARDGSAEDGDDDVDIEEEPSEQDGINLELFYITFIRT
ncbi:hypothetical protein V490_05834 [Pseudogymnoascus sp. VKM F-3557]|nr:hypothetical protein V490_05834 [Pseudogymnoascus sp. VKM F-3557]